MYGFSKQHFIHETNTLLHHAIENQQFIVMEILALQSIGRDIVGVQQMMYVKMVVNYKGVGKKVTAIIFRLVSYRNDIRWEQVTAKYKYIKE